MDAIAAISGVLSYALTPGRALRSRVAIIVATVDDILRCRIVATTAALPKAVRWIMVTER